ncbi:TauD/TfdA family dioxygenase [Streptomyces sp. NPDC057287]|uniref:TauD/TfdA family dioxygenase n=1 Tax=Streptomyces sp. NPDC057287 TaxID=3346086 RepID=UPI00362CF653
MTSVDMTLQPLAPERDRGRTAMVRVPAGDDPATWLPGARDGLRVALDEHGAVLVRGLDLRNPEAVAEVLRLLDVEAVVEREAFATRQTYHPGVYSSSAWPPNQPMCMHHELSYTLDFPGLLLLVCLSEPGTGGTTGLADAAGVLEDLPDELTERFAREGWLLTRSYNGEIGATVSEAFGTDSREAVESYCRDHAVSYEWQPDGGLRTAQRRSAVVRHPVDGRRCWFNQIAFLNEWTLAPEVRGFLVEEYGADGLPFNTWYGDGEPIEEDVVRRINAVYEERTVSRPWEAGDLLLVDNIRTAHSREAFEGPRDVVVAMAAPTRLDTCSPTIGRTP